MTTSSDYGLWWLVILNTAIFIIFAFSFTHPKTNRDWRSFGAFSAFLVALFSEMYGFPLTIYFFSGWLTKWAPGLDLFTHNSGHILEDLFGWGGNPHFGPFHIASYLLIFYGFLLLSNAWRVLYKAQQDQVLTIIMFPILVWMYTRLAKSEEEESIKIFGAVWDEYVRNTPAFIPRLTNRKMLSSDKEL